MFTGIIEDIGRVKSASRGRLSVETRLDGINPGDSVAVDGVCLTAAVFADGIADFDVSPETLSRTTLGSLRRGDSVNLERALAAGGRLGGHIVSGHVDAVAKIAGIRKSGGFTTISVAAPTEYIVEKGSVAVNGVSLTVAWLDESRKVFGAALVPHTLEKTTFARLRAGSRVNIEYDIAAKYARKYAAGRFSSGGSLTEEKLKNAGF